jgi:hypothetical protein
MAYQDFLIDKRILQRNIDKGLVDPKQYDKLLGTLPDRAENVAPVEVDEDEDDDQDDDEG